MAKRKTNPKQQLATVSSGGAHRYAHEFKLNVVAFALRNGEESACTYYDMSRTTVSKWVRQLRAVDRAAAGKLGTVENPYRATPYALERRMSLSDKLFAELELSLEAHKMKAGGAVPADVLQKLVSAYGLLVDKRRLEEGAHTALVQAVKDPEEIYREGEAQVVEFKQRAALPPGSSTASG